ncbi:Bcgcd1 [Botrytis cinerea B05.10]|uniref:Translation initiation factor eIF2B subunit gamma n=3 Tax=Botryotinia fuckeliana TaxID=40559 RepID=A0A384JD35_BOTFB|nr:Bcgcd1 [Botrytis cinerea B05.10]ATZ48224.1 Bcgcd1 [Botrytis cinerea B05.10]EMR83153.1 putative eukaryotic translation initiation factor eif-2b subunit 3 protein [Botrytis cinerea BcDW1]CCD51687.1 similar to translation initiation factor eif-2b gamma subunit [Botrytis cinerea T4]
MPHAMPAPGFQAIILCGPGSSFPTFTSNPDKNPKALIPIANRPMVWYPIDFCYRMGVTNITLITPPSSEEAIKTALATNPHLTSLPLPKPDLLAPEELDQTTGTAQIFRLPEVRNIIKGDFIVLPCDLVCELGGESLIESWMVKEGGLGGATGGDHEGPKMALGGERGGRRGGLGVWYETKSETPIKGEETDFIAISPLAPTSVPSSKSSLIPHVSNLLYSVPTDTLKDIVEDKKGLPIRHALVRSHPRIRMLSSHRDAHIYIFPAWVLDMISANEHMDNIGEDVIGWWSKAGWQQGLGDKLGLRDIFEKTRPDESDDNMLDNGPASDDVDYGNLSSTWTSNLEDPSSKKSSDNSTASDKSNLAIPPILAYIHPSKPTAEESSPLIRRVDTAPILLNVSLQLAKIEAIDQVGRDAASPFAHNSKIAWPEGIAQKTTVRPDCLLAENVIVEEKCIIKECVIGANCQIKTGARLTRCVLMDGVTVGSSCTLTDCVLGKGSVIGDKSELQDCEVQEEFDVDPGTNKKKDRLMSAAGLGVATEDEIQEFNQNDSDGSESD